MENVKLFTGIMERIFGAANKLNKLSALLRNKIHNDKVRKLLDQDQIEWYNIPSHAPNFGGLWKSVRSVTNTI